MPGQFATGTPLQRRSWHEEGELPMHAIASITLKDRRRAVIDANPPGVDAALRAIMVVHTAVWFSIEA